MIRHFLALNQFTKEELDGLFTLSRELKDKQKQGVPHRLLEGKSVALIFEKSSTRTRVSFEVGVAQLGAHPLFISSATSQMGRGEPIKDTARVMARYCDGVMIRTYGQEIVEEFARYSSVPVINGLTDLFHPCQIMADLFTVIEYKGGYQGLKFAWVGDGNNMANTWIEAAAILGFDLALACPTGYEPDRQVWDWAQQRATSSITITEDPEEAVRDADVVNTDVWASMGQEQEQKEREAAFQGYCLDDALVALARPDCMVLHCLPAHRGEEITDSVIEGPRSAVWDEAENRLHIQKAIMASLMK
ncbi:ornithine carbamoyltransferase [Geobacter sulfurreducens]|jgi:ornithine carbamoyltransferase|uniref:Ornithine carbamoyltransferase n=1 Tax=Geobacter sulfurreducens (strain ATCC 51573 / DSM 12127 / PCA) TaxID=243231 RepID=OTC_GEOSL|nr:ornithine carbamoyltransferase [Geobacter sulfurreducens]Q74GU2.1 RecName: Full=Ornithine carbamoyltransferase; Short=OTCase [Geobacter sulfurreducens PCA]AAR33487.1 ornithine carbamyltransferase [Geobacter sulfurreducens PCA]ADI82991.1 ornithine carbamyltransferase [Geobacter sulfurreducens KN400]AJY69888.1 ornithine carbamoyltransferase [Geobacter sulfurreducens]QVW35430.1 ornithine carbamoyltransferase [Geobacter sulfurreducens]UAC04253.1 ornithine carbamoyltransferase [Geobacter sulfur